MFEDLDKGVVLRDVIADILRAGPRSISQVGKALQERGLKLHRLAVAGYLKASADAGFLEEQEIPPAKVYALKPGAAQRDLYRRVADRCREEAAGPEAARIYLQVLCDLFRRPVFQEEFRRGGLPPPVPAQEVSGDERQQARRFLSGAPLKLPFNDPAYRNRYRDAADEEQLRERARALLAALVREDYHATSLAVTTRQATLGGGA